MKFTSTGDGDKEVVVLLPHISYTSNRCQSSIIKMTEVPKHLTVGTIGGAAQLIVGHPFDSINVKLQSQSADSRAPLKVSDLLGKHPHLMKDGFLAGDMDKIALPLMEFGCKKEGEPENKMKITALLVLKCDARSDGSDPVILANATDVNHFGYFQRVTVRQFIVFVGRTVIKRTPPEQRHSVQHEGYL
ncbi:hypothetical protein L2E82_13121 [Cichorium intybus]|uniref:Uncharacterized protein n=1 Tax=Cichorium intybus TaxID=13427 RepID=A0ACB9GHQ1_CICIN|nr:hypothetical protein L2E82_13121 [Cichorium intybus]